MEDISFETVKIAQEETAVIKPFKNQVYESLKGNFNSSRLFEDNLYPANNNALYYKKTPPAGIKWMRPKEARANAQFVVNDFNRNDMDQGAVGNCWFIAAVAGILQSPALFAKVVPADQSFDNQYGGIFHFRFWQYGEWVDVVVDDKLPFKADNNFLFCFNRQEPNEFWCPLLEKAYAKVYGNYENLSGGQTFDALVDMSGGLQEQFNLKSLDENIKYNFWTIMNKGFTMTSIMGCSINPDPNVTEAVMANGLVRGHAYTITKLITLNGTQLVRIRNPWGNNVEWNGRWSENSAEWNSVSPAEKEDAGFVKSADGEFWMSFDDFMNIWDYVQICHLTAESFSDEVIKSQQNNDLTWKCTTYQSAWEAGKSAGGCGQNDQAKYWTNPQFLVTLTDVDNQDNENKATLLVALMQKDTRIKRLRTKDASDEEFIQFRIFKIKDGVEVDENKTTGLKFYANQLDKIGASGSYINLREVTKRFRLDPGHYIIIPSTYHEDRSCEFMLRVFTETPIDSNHLPGDKDNLTDDDFFFVIDGDIDGSVEKWISILKPILFKGKKKGGKTRIKFLRGAEDGEDNDGEDDNEGDEGEGDEVPEEDQE